MEKPITLQIEEFKKNIATIVNDSNLPPFILDYIFKDLYSEIHMLNQNQLTKDMQEYEKASKESTT